MVTAHRTGKDDLRAIAHDAMLQRGLLPDFSSAVIAQVRQITQAAPASGAAIRYLRGLLWASIDNDDSRDLDQLSVAELWSAIIRSLGLHRLTPANDG